MKSEKPIFGLVFYEIVKQFSQKYYAIVLLIILLQQVLSLFLSKCNSNVRKYSRDSIKFQV